MAIKTSIYLNDDEQSLLVKIAEKHQIFKKDKSEYSLTETLKFVLDEYVNNQENNQNNSLNTHKMIEQIHATIPHIMFQSTLAGQAIFSKLDQENRPKLRNTSMDITVETCGQFQEVDYEEITTSLDQRNIKSLPIDKDKNQWK